MANENSSWKNSSSSKSSSNQEHHLVIVGKDFCIFSTRTLGKAQGYLLSAQHLLSRTRSSNLEVRTQKLVSSWRHFLTRELVSFKATRQPDSCTNTNLAVAPAKPQQGSEKRNDSLQNIFRLWESTSRSSQLPRQLPKQGQGLRPPRKSFKPNRCFFETSLRSF